VQRIWQHKNDLTAGFARRYGVHTLVWHEVHETMASAIAREKAVKGWRRAWKVRLIAEGSRFIGEEMNPDWHDLYDTLL
jgi:putative endonuclease